MSSIPEYACPPSELRVFKGAGIFPVPEAVRMQEVRFYVSATFRGASSFFEVYYDDSFDANTGGSLADGVLARCDTDYEQVYGIFGSVTPPLPMTCIIYTGPGGYHHGCLGSVLYVTGLTLQPPNVPDVATALAVLVAEEVEVFSAAQGEGWNCGDTNGEGLSRVLAEELYPGTLDYYHTASIWLDSSRPDYVTNNVGNDSDKFSNGCAVVFLYYLHYILGYEWATIVQAGGSTLRAPDIAAWLRAVAGLLIWSFVPFPVCRGLFPCLVSAIIDERFTVAE